MKLFKGWRRERLQRLPFPAEWERVVQRNVVFFGQLSSADRQELLGHTQVLLDEKHFEGCDGLELTDEIRVTVAAYASILLLHRSTDYYPRLTSILIYPTSYLATGERYVGGGVWEDGEKVRGGETGARLGAVVVNWEDVPRDVAANDSSNVVLHEFAHQLDAEDFVMDGTPLLDRGQHTSWAEVFAAEYDALCRAIDAGEPTLIRSYGAKNRIEFFAVATELFFHRGADLRDRHPALYRELRTYYGQDPAAWQRTETTPALS